MKISGIKTIKDVVVDLMQDLAVKKTVDCRSDFSVCLKKTLTKKEQKHIKINYFKRGVLNVNVDSSVWLYNLTLRKEDLLAEFNKRSTVVKDIRFRLGKTI